MKLPLLIPVAFLLARLGAVTAQESTMTIPGDTDQTETLQTSPTPTDAGGSTSTGSATATQTNASQASPSALVAGPGEVIVAPKQGDLRMVPFNINVKQGDNITFIFGAGPHTVTRSSLLTICNASDAEGAFQSGRQDAGFRFPVQVKTNETQSYYCGVPGHCEKGMFGLINGLTVAVPGQGSFEQAIPDMAANNTELMSLWNETKSKCDKLKQPKAWEWGNNLKTDQIAPWAMLSAMENILYTRQYFAENPSLLPSATASGTNPSSTGDSGSGAAHSIATSSISLALLVTFCILLIHQA